MPVKTPAPSNAEPRDLLTERSATCSVVAQLKKQDRIYKILRMGRSGAAILFIL